MRAPPVSNPRSCWNSARVIDLPSTGTPSADNLELLQAVQITVEQKSRMNPQPKVENWLVVGGK